MKSNRFLHNFFFVIKLLWHSISYSSCNNESIDNFSSLWVQLCSLLCIVARSPEKVEKYNVLFIDRHQEQRGDVRLGIGWIFAEFQYRFEAGRNYPDDALGLRSVAYQPRTQGDIGTSFETDGTSQGHGDPEPQLWRSINYLPQGHQRQSTRIRENVVQEKHSWRSAWGYQRRSGIEFYIEEPVVTMIKTYVKQ